MNLRQREKIILQCNARIIKQIFIKLDNFSNKLIFKNLYFFIAFIMIYTGCAYVLYIYVCGIILRRDEQNLLLHNPEHTLGCRKSKFCPFS